MTARLASRTFVRIDPACDSDPALGICQFQAEVCLNVSDPSLPSCAPQALESFFIENEQPDTNPRHDFDFQTLEDQLNFLVLPLAASELNVCSGEVQMNLQLPIQPSGPEVVSAAAGSRSHRP